MTFTSNELIWVFCAGSLMTTLAYRVSARRFERRWRRERQDMERTLHAEARQAAALLNARSEALGLGAHIEILPLDTDLAAADALLRDVANQDGRGGSP